MTPASNAELDGYPSKQGKPNDKSHLVQPFEAALLIIQFLYQLNARCFTDNPDEISQEYEGNCSQCSSSLICINYRIETIQNTSKELPMSTYLVLNRGITFELAAR